MIDKKIKDLTKEEMELFRPRTPFIDTETFVAIAGAAQIEDIFTLEKVTEMLEDPTSKDMPPSVRKLFEHVKMIKERQENGYIARHEYVSVEELKKKYPK